MLHLQQFTQGLVGKRANIKDDKYFFQEKKIHKNIIRNNKKEEEMPTVPDA